MSREPLRSLIVGYALGALIAALLVAGGFGAVAAGLTFWLGGALATIGLAWLRLSIASQEKAADCPETPLVSASLARWETDRRGDAKDEPARARAFDSA